MRRSVGGFKAALAIVAAVGTMFASSMANAAILTNYTPLGESNHLLVTTYAPTQQTSDTTLSNLYGSPTITPVAAGWKLSFIPSSAFFAGANNYGGGKDSEVRAKLDFIVTFDAPIQLTLNIFEDGLYRTSGIGVVSVFGGAVITAQDASNETRGNAGLTPVLNPNGFWTAFDQVTGFTTGHFSYKISIDNDLLAFAGPSQVLSSAIIAKKNFSIIITTDGSSGSGPPIPEPASLSVLAVGTLALLSRRRR